MGKKKVNPIGGSGVGGGGDGHDGNDSDADGQPLVGQSLFVVEQIRDRRLVNDEVQYLVKWREFDEKDNTWEPIDNLIDGCHHLIRQFESMHVPPASPPPPEDNEVIINNNKTETTTTTITDTTVAATVVADNTTDENDGDLVLLSDTDSDETVVSEEEEEEVTTKTTDDRLETTTSSSICEPNNTTCGQTIKRVITKSCSKPCHWCPHVVYTVFPVGLRPEKIVKAAFDGKNIWFWIKWLDTADSDDDEVVSIVLGKQANIVCPQLVIKYYESRLLFD
ncbi:heterochromatin protein 1-like [Oppia nitens]|uniref:heterochromatin protein 1-like n=1 Tax=Oppia nitens TaxID=1686743 RepID=UPI0023DA8994|nr:heterochromatin protein 1-like [Oppia nitens]